MSDVGDNLATLIAAWTAMLRTGSSAELASILDPNVVWQGILAYQTCHDRTEVLGILARNPRRPPRLSRIEAQEIGDCVAVSVDGPDFPDNEVLTANDPRSLIFRFREGKVVRMESYPNRDAAFEAAQG